MKTPLAWKNLSHNRVRTAIGVAGVGFAVILIFMQMGFHGAIKKTATQIYDALDFDLMLRSPQYNHLTEPSSFPRARVFQAASLPEVEVARSFYLGLSEWQAPTRGDFQPTADIPDENPPGQWRGIITMGSNPNDPGFVSKDICQLARQLSDPSFVLVDSKSKPEYGPVNKQKFTEQDIGVETALGLNNRIRIIGLFKLGTGMASNGACLTSPEGYVRACSWQTIADVNFGLIKLHDDNSAEQVKRRLLAIYGIPESAANMDDQPEAVLLTNRDVEILTRADVNKVEEEHWTEGTPLGRIFYLGVWVALFVGVAIVYQVLSTDIANMMGEYATLKAMGYSNKYLTIVVLQQSVLLALVGYVPSVLISWILYQVIENISGMPMSMSPDILIYVLLLAIGMCVLSGTAALRKLFQADPADLF